MDKDHNTILVNNIRSRMMELGIPSIRDLEKIAQTFQKNPELSNRDTVRNLLAGRTKTMRSEKLEPLAKALQTTVEKLVERDVFDRTNCVFLPKYDLHLSADSSTFPKGEPVLGHIPFDKGWIEKSVAGNTENLIAMEMSGDSMEPLIRSGDVVVLNLSDTDIVDGSVYGIIVNESVVLKRIFSTPDGMEIRSENPIHLTWNIKKDDIENLQIIGRAAFRVGKF